MTNEEAIKRLKEFKILHTEQHGWDVSTLKALDMAIKALELQERFERFTRQDDMHLVTIKQIKQVMEDEWL